MMDAFRLFQRTERGRFCLNDSLESPRAPWRVVAVVVSLLAVDPEVLYLVELGDTGQDV